VNTIFLGIHILIPPFCKLDLFIMMQCYEYCLCLLNGLSYKKVCVNLLQGSFMRSTTGLFTIFVAINQPISLVKDGYILMQAFLAINCCQCLWQMLWHKFARGRLKNYIINHLISDVYSLLKTMIEFCTRLERKRRKQN